MTLSKDEQKVLAASSAVDTLITEGKIFSGMKIGLGTGSTKREDKLVSIGDLKSR